MSDDAPWISIEEAAAQVGRSVATVRRWAGDGTVRARKNGKLWLIDPASLGRLTPASAVRPESLTGVDLDASWGHLVDEDLEAPWVPDVLAFRDHIANAAEVKVAAAVRLEDAGPFGQAIYVEVPKSALLTRNGALLSIEDRLAYQAAVDSIAERIDRQTPGSVFSARLDRDGNRWLKPGPEQWVRWSGAVLRSLESGNKWMIKTDLVSYYDIIPHRLLFGDIDSMNPDPQVAAALKRMLGTWTGERSVGIPQGPVASSLLGNLYLLPVDYAMESDDWSYFRYMDDIRITAPTRRAAVDGLHVLERECRRRGLVLSSSKTRELMGDAAMDDMRDTELDHAAYAWNVGNRPIAVDLIRHILLNSVKDDERPEGRKLRFSLNRLMQIQDGQDIDWILDRLEQLSPDARTVVQYLWPWMETATVVHRVEAFLLDKERNTSPYMASWIIAALLDLGKPLGPHLARYARRVVRDRNQPVYLRILAVNLLALCAMPGEISSIRSQLMNEFDPVLARGYLTALARAHSSEASTTRQLVARMPELQRTMRFIQGRASLPTLVYRFPPPRRK